MRAHLSKGEHKKEDEKEERAKNAKGGSRDAPPRKRASTHWALDEKQRARQKLRAL